MLKYDVPYSDLDTPAILVDMEKLETNIRTMANLAAKAGVKLRPHTKAHLSPYIAKLQVKTGASGICVAKIGEAQVMAYEGLDNIMIVHPFYGDHKFQALKELILQKPELKLCVVVDMIEQAKRLSEVGHAVGRKIPVLLKIKTGILRFGILPEEAVNMAKKLSLLPGIDLAGIKAHEATRGANSPEANERVALQTAAIVAEVARALNKGGFQIREVAVGSTPSILGTLRFRTRFPEITEIHPGSYVFGDAQYIHRSWFTEETVAVTVLTTVISVSQDWAVIDAGYMTFGAYLPNWLQTDYGYDRFGIVKGRPDLKLSRLSQEVGIVTFTDSDKSLSIGERLEIIPNHAALVVNLHSHMYGVRNSKVETVIPVTGRDHGN